MEEEYVNKEKVNYRSLGKMYLDKWKLEENREEVAGIAERQCCQENQMLIDVRRKSQESGQQWHMF